MALQGWPGYRTDPIVKRPLSIVVIAVTAITWVVAAKIFGLPDTFWEAILPFFTAVTVTGIFLVIYDRYLWHFYAVRQWVAQRPDLQGVWKVTIRPVKLDEHSEQAPDAIIGYAQFDQTASSLSMRLYTEDSRSTTIAYAIRKIEQNQFRLVIVYQNRPKVKERAREGTIHDGTAIYEFGGYSPERLAGEYWTEKPTRGEIELSDRRTDKIDSYEAGSRVYSRA